MKLRPVKDMSGLVYLAFPEFEGIEVVRTGQIGNTKYYWCDFTVNSMPLMSAEIRNAMAAAPDKKVAPFKLSGESVVARSLQEVQADLAA